MKPITNDKSGTLHSGQLFSQTQLVFFELHQPGTAVYLAPSAVQNERGSLPGKKPALTQEEINRLIQKHIGLVHSCMTSVLGVTSLNEDDVFQAGMIGLWKAIRTFDESRNIKFSSYASMCIRREMHKEVKLIRNNASGLYLEEI